MHLDALKNRNVQLALVAAGLFAWWVLRSPAAQPGAAALQPAVNPATGMIVPHAALYSDDPAVKAAQAAARAAARGPGGKPAAAVTLMLQRKADRRAYIAAHPELFSFGHGVANFLQ